MTEQALEGTAVEMPPESIDGERHHELVPVAATPALAVTPVVKATELVARLDVIREAADKAMQRDVDFGVIPGTDKPTLYKPGAEKLGVLFQLDIQLANDKTWGPGDHLTVVSRATVFHAPSGARLGFGEGVCSTRERKYAYRKQERICPSCGKPAVIKGKAEFGGGWLCWKKRDGCGAKFADNAPEIVGQEVGEIDNPDLPDLWNTVVKMAEKRARVDAVLAVTGASALFTQDMEDHVAASDEVTPTQTPTPVPAPAPAAAPPAANGHAVKAEPPKKTEKAATAKQRGMINGKADEKRLDSAQLANLLLAVAGQPPRDFDNPEQAQQFVNRNLDRLPGRRVDDVLAAIEQAETDDIPY
jgi:ribosomal protein L37AE/L43A